MNDLADLLKADLRGIIAQVATWVADPGGLGAGERYRAILDSITVHARFVDMALAPLIAPTCAPAGSLGGQVIRVHHTVMALIDGLKHAVGKGHAWAMRLGILTEVIVPHLILHDHLLLNALHEALPSSQFDDLGDIFRTIKDECARGAARAPGRLPSCAMPIAPGHRPPAWRNGHYPAHHPDPASPWRAASAARGARTGHGPARTPAGQQRG